MKISDSQKKKIKIVVIVVIIVLILWFMVISPILNFKKNEKIPIGKISFRRNDFSNGDFSVIQYF